MWDTAFWKLSNTITPIEDTPNLVRKAIRNPKQILPFVIGTMFPNSRWGREWMEQHGVITFKDGGFAGGRPSRSELSARIYYEVQQLQSMLAGHRYERSLEIGCGYGRLSAWIAEHAEQSVAVEPNDTAIKQGKTLYPNLNFIQTTGGSLPFNDDSFDLVVTWCVLQHVPPESIEAVTSEITRVLTGTGRILLCEETSGDQGRADWPRSKDTYESYLSPYDLKAVNQRDAEPTFAPAEYIETMVFANDNAHPHCPKRSSEHSRRAKR